MARWIGLDFGMARIGVSVSDETHLIAFPLFTIKAEKKGEETVKKLLLKLEEYCQKNKTAIELFVIGMPYLLSGKKGLLADEVEHFIALLKTVTPLPIEIWDERLTSKQAERVLRESTMTRKRQAEYVDTAAAANILQNYLDAKRFNL